MVSRRVEPETQKFPAYTPYPKSTHTSLVVFDTIPRFMTALAKTIVGFILSGVIISMYTVDNL